jgi:hypothetical protein
MTNNTNKPPEAWSADNWLDADAEDTTTLDPDTAWTHRGESIHEEVVAGRDRRDALHHVVTTLAELRRAAGRTQVDIAEDWGRPQSKVSRLESDPTRAEIATLLGYVAAIGGHLTVEAEIDGETYRYELV